ncbi:MAG: ATP-binding protein [Ignavibacteria bacterium]|jgi:signal transduction histidine kinase
MRDLRTFFAHNPKDTEEIKLEKFAAFLVAGSCTFAGVVWTAMYYFILDWGFTTLLPAAFVVIVGSALLISHITKNHYYVINAQIICIIYIPSMIQWSIGSPYNSGFVMVWAFLGPICALMFFPVKKAVFWLSLYLSNLVISVIFNSYFVSHGQLISESTKLLFFIMNLGFASIVVFAFAGYYVNAAVREQKKANKLLESNLRQEMLLRQNEKLATLGKLSAGVAHELNNPASAALRGAEHLKENLFDLEKDQYNLGKLNLTKQQLGKLKELNERVHDNSKQISDLDPLSRDDLENEFNIWFENKGIHNNWELTSMLIDAGIKTNDLVEVAENFSSEQFPVVVSSLGSKFTTYNLTEEIKQGTGRITQIVNALKSYTFLGEAPVQLVNLHEGLDNTLVILRSQLVKGITVVRDYCDDLLRVQAYGSELNQVWTNILDNAIDAMNGNGKITIKTYTQDKWAVVEITDNGPGIPEELLSKVFDPFFTTKPPGEGTGMGLNISHNIITQKHKGEINVKSKPGETCFQVKLPIMISEN